MRLLCSVFEFQMKCLLSVYGYFCFSSCKYFDVPFGFFVILWLEKQRKLENAGGNSEWERIFQHVEASGLDVLANSVLHLPDNAKDAGTERTTISPGQGIENRGMCLSLISSVICKQSIVILIFRLSLSLVQVQGWERALHMSSTWPDAKSSSQLVARMSWNASGKIFWNVIL